MLGHCRFWRRLRGGSWARVSGLMFGQRWVRVSPFCRERVDEMHGRGLWHRPFDYANDWWWVPFYCRFAWFHLYRCDSDNSWVVVWHRGEAPEVTGYTIDSSSWTPRGCQKSAQASVFFNTLMDELGPDGRAALVASLKEPRP